MILKRNVLLLLLLLNLTASVRAESGQQENIPYGSNSSASQYASVNGIDMYYEVYGSGAPLLLIHGNGQSITDLHFQIEYFSRNYKVVVADSRGHGKSGAGAAPLTYIQMMEDYNGLLEHLNLAGANVLGWSDGGILALLLAIHHPDKLQKMAVMGANLRPDQTAVYEWVAELLQPLSEMTDVMIAAGDTSNNWQLQRQLLDLLTTQPDIPIESLHTIQIPALVIAGDKDIIRGSHTLEIFENLPNAHLAILPGQTHWAPVTDPDGFNLMVQRFFNTPYSRPTSEAILTAELNASEH